jgi:two-component system, cell cycle response regulator
MPTPHAVCLLGFSAFERDALAAQFRLALHRQPAYRLVESLESARFAVVDGDVSRVVDAVEQAGRCADAVFVGHRAPPAALARLARPIDALSVLRELDTALLLSLRPAPGPLAGGTADTATSSSAASDDHARTEPSALFESPSLSALADLFPDRQPSVQAPAPAPDAAALIVDDSEIACRFLQQRLAALGISAKAVTTSQAAMAHLAQHPVQLALLDIDLGDASEADGLSLCQHIKRHLRPAPLVALVTAHTSSTDRVRGSLAGCDAHLGKPLQADELAALVARLHKAEPRRRRAKPLA